MYKVVTNEGICNKIEGRSEGAKQARQRILKDGMYVQRNPSEADKKESVCLVKLLRRGVYCDGVCM